MLETGINGEKFFKGNIARDSQRGESSFYKGDIARDRQRGESMIN